MTEEQRDSVVAPAKINLALHVGGPRADGYHPVDTWTVYLDAGDRLSAGDAADDDGLEVTGPRARELSPGSDNLVLRAARAFRARCPDTEPRRLILEKHLPLASGVGGGTANGAAALVLLNRHAGKPLGETELTALSRTLGADGPICLAPILTGRGSVRGTGIGGDLRPGPRLPPLFVCLATPPVSLATGSVFAAYDRAGNFPPTTMELPERVASYGDLAALLGTLRNDLAGPAETLCPRIARLRMAMSRRPGCLFARMSGSGASVFGLFASAGAARAAAHAIGGGGTFAAHGKLYGTTS